MPKADRAAVVKKWRTLAGEPIEFKAKFSLRLDVDVLALLNATSQSGVIWPSVNYAINALLRRPLRVFAPEGFPLRNDPFADAVIATAEDKAKSRKPRRK